MTLLFKCAICLERSSNDHFGFLIDCGHGFHIECLRHVQQPNCPTCRRRRRRKEVIRIRPESPEIVNNETQDNNRTTIQESITRHLEISGNCQNTITSLRQNVREASAGVLHKTIKEVEKQLIIEKEAENVESASEAIRMATMANRGFTTRALEAAKRVEMHMEDLAQANPLTVVSKVEMFEAMKEVKSLITTAGEVTSTIRRMSEAVEGVLASRKDLEEAVRPMRAEEVKAGEGPLATETVLGIAEAFGRDLTYLDKTKADEALLYIRFLFEVEQSSTSSTAYSILSSISELETQGEETLKQAIKAKQEAECTLPSNFEGLGRSFVKAVKENRRLRAAFRVVALAMEIKVRRRNLAEECATSIRAIAKSLNREHCEVAAIRIMQLEDMRAKLESSSQKVSQAKEVLLRTKNINHAQRGNRKNDLAEQNVNLATETVLLRQSIEKAGEIINFDYKPTPDPRFSDEQMEAQIRIMQDRAGHGPVTEGRVRNQEWFQEMARTLSVASLNQRQIMTEDNAMAAVSDTYSILKYDQDTMIEEIKKDLEDRKLHLDNDVNVALEVNASEVKHPTFC